MAPGRQVNVDKKKNFNRVSGILSYFPDTARQLLRYLVIVLL